MMLSGQYADFDEWDDDGDADAGGGAPASADGADGDGSDAMDLTGSGGGSGADGEDEEDPDAALARRLHEEEQREIRRRMLEYSGFARLVRGGGGSGGGGGGSGDGSGGDGDDDDGDGDAIDELDVDALSYEALQALGDVAGTVSRGLAPEAIAALPAATLATLRAAGRCGGSGGDCGSGAGRCAVCMVDFEEDDALRLLPCAHFYHQGCIDQWLGVNKVCPVCTKEVTAAAPAGPDSAAAGAGATAEAAP